MKICVVGATGLVGKVMLKVMEERGLIPDEFIPVASERSVGKEVYFNGKSYQMLGVEQALEKQPDLALFSAGGAASLELAPRFAAAGCIVIDNSSAWRKDPAVPLVVPEVNAGSIRSTDRIIANPNCSTIQLVVAMWPLHKKYGIKRLVISTYQSVTGSGVKGLNQLKAEQQSQIPESKAYPHQIHMNLIPHGGEFDASGYTSEEQKLVFETNKIMYNANIAVTATVVRVPVTGGHSMAVNAEFERSFEIKDVNSLMCESDGIQVLDEPTRFEYPMPLMSEGRDEVFVGRIRRDDSIANGLNMWIVADNLRKGAATNAVQIAQWIIQNHDLK